MRKVINPTVSLPATSSRDALTDILRQGAQQLLKQGIEAEVAEWIDILDVFTETECRHYFKHCGYDGARQYMSGGEQGVGEGSCSLLTVCPANRIGGASIRRAPARPGSRLVR